MSKPPEEKPPADEKPATESVLDEALSKISVTQSLDDALEGYVREDSVRSSETVAEARAAAREASARRAAESQSAQIDDLFAQAALPETEKGAEKKTPKAP